MPDVPIPLADFHAICRTTFRVAKNLYHQLGVTAGESTAEGAHITWVLRYHPANRPAAKRYQVIVAIEDTNAPQ